jgi:hypothetical protein
VDFIISNKREVSVFNTLKFDKQETRQSPSPNGKKRHYMKASVNFQLLSQRLNGNSSSRKHGL